MPRCLRNLCPRLTPGEMSLLSRNCSRFDFFTFLFSLFSSCFFTHHFSSSSGTWFVPRCRVPPQAAPLATSEHCGASPLHAHKLDSPHAPGAKPPSTRQRCSHFSSLSLTFAHRQFFSFSFSFSFHSFFNEKKFSGIGSDFNEISKKYDCEIEADQDWRSPLWKHMDYNELQSKIEGWTAKSLVSLETKLCKEGTLGIISVTAGVRKDKKSKGFILLYFSLPFLWVAHLDTVFLQNGYSGFSTRSWSAQNLPTSWQPKRAITMSSRTPSMSTPFRFVRLSLTWKTQRLVFWIFFFLSPGINGVHWSFSFSFFSQLLRLFWSKILSSLSQRQRRREQSGWPLFTVKSHGPSLPTPWRRSSCRKPFRLVGPFVILILFIQ